MEKGISSFGDTLKFLTCQVGKHIYLVSGKSGPDSSPGYAQGPRTREEAASMTAPTTTVDYELEDFSAEDPRTLAALVGSVIALHTPGPALYFAVVFAAVSAVWPRLFPTA